MSQRVAHAAAFLPVILTVLIVVVAILAVQSGSAPP
jgi:hypothetical protein